MKKDTKAQWTLYRTDKKEIGFVYELEGVMDDDPRVGFITIANGQIVQTRELISSLVSISFQEKVTWITEHARTLANLGSDVVWIITDVNDVTGQVKQVMEAIPEQNPVIRIVKSLTGNPIRRQVREACPDIEAALQSNTPALTVKEAHEVWDGISFLCMRYSGTLEEKLNTLLSKLEAMFPEEKF